MSTATAVKERPIIFTGHSPPAILDGRKTMTRRAVRTEKLAFHPTWIGWLDDAEDGPGWYAREIDSGQFEPAECWNEAKLACPHGKAGDRLWVKEAWCLKEGQHGICRPVDCWYAADRQEVRRVDGDGFQVFCKDGSEASPWSSPLFMPRWASRILLEITEIRVERLHAITEADAVAEGFDVDLCGRVLRQAAGKARMEFARWLELPNGSEPDGYWCLDCVDKEAKKRGARVCGWNECFENDHAPRCEECGGMLHHSLTRYGIKTELGLTDEDATRILYTPAKGDSALALAELAEGMGDWSDEYAGRLAQIGFGTAWNKLNAKRGFGWDLNPWVWVISFRRLEPAS